MTTLFGNISNSDNRRPIQNIAERAPSPDEADRRMLDHHAAKTRVAIPAKVVSFNATKQTIVAQPLIREKIIDRSTGSIQWIQLPPILDVPVQFDRGGNFVLTVPIQAGDEVLLVFNDMSIDSWWASGGIQNWIDRRRHDLSDAVAIPGIASVPKAISNFSTNSAELRTLDGSVKIKLEADKITLIEGAQSIEMSSSQILLKFSDNQSIKLSSAGVEITGTLKINGFSYLAHTHADPASGTTGPVIP